MSWLIYCIWTLYLNSFLFDYVILLVYWSHAHVMDDSIRFDVYYVSVVSMIETFDTQLGRRKFDLLPKNLSPASNFLWLSFVIYPFWDLKKINWGKVIQKKKMLTKMSGHIADFDRERRWWVRKSCRLHQTSKVLWDFQLYNWVVIF